MSKRTEITSRSYTPYSGRNESCYVVGESGLFYPGVRIENISYPLTVSAVRAAICSCLANGDNPIQIIQLEMASELTEFWESEFNIEVTKTLPSDFNIYDPFKTIRVESSNILKELDKLCIKAITPHSDFPVAALLKTQEGWIEGVNVEVSAWSQGLCAERVAITRAISHGCNQLEMIHVYAPKSEFCSPCGSCRQVLNEFMPESEIELHHKNRTHSRHFIHHLLPLGISTNYLKK